MMNETRTIEGSNETSEGVQYDVAVVGAGPVGATLAALLAQGGSRVFIGDASTEVYPLPRAAHFDHEVMRVFQQLEIADSIRDWITPADRYVFQNQHGDILLDFDLHAPASSGWQGYMMHQPGIEIALRERLISNPLVDLRTGCKFNRFEAGTDVVSSHWETSDGPVVVTSRFLVGCDGAWSPVREQASLPLQDLQFDEPWLVLDVIVEEENGLPRYNTQYCDPERPTTYVIMGNLRRRFEFMLKPGETPEQMMEDASIAELLKPWDTQGLRSVERKAVYRFHALVAERWRNGRVFIAGDSAHQMPPFAGQGMCSGIRDAAALAWRLPLAEASADPRRLLDSYQAERDPHVRAITAAAIETGRVVCTLDAAMAAGRDAQMLASKAAGDPMPDISSPALQLSFGLPETPRAGEQFFQPWSTDANDSPVRLDDVLGPGAWLLYSAAPDVPEPADRTAVRMININDQSLEAFGSALRGWLDDIGAEAVLVRADRYIFGTGAPKDLIAAYVSQSGIGDP